MGQNSAKVHHPVELVETATTQFTKSSEEIKEGQQSNQRPWYCIPTQSFQCPYCSIWSSEYMMHYPSVCFDCSKLKNRRMCQFCMKDIVKPELAAHQTKCYKERLLKNLAICSTTNSRSDHNEKGQDQKEVVIKKEEEERAGSDQEVDLAQRKEEKDIALPPFSSLPPEVLSYIVSFLAARDQEKLFYLSTKLHRACMYWLADSRARAYVERSGHVNDKNGQFMMGHQIPETFKGYLGTTNGFRCALSTCGMGEHLLDAIFSNYESINLNGVDRQVQLAFQPDWCIGPPFLKVKYLTAKNCCLSPPVFLLLLSRLPNLKHLNIRGTKVYSLDDIGQMALLLPHLEYINLQETAVEVHLDKIWKAKKNQDWLNRKRLYEQAVKANEKNRGKINSVPPDPGPEPKAPPMPENPFPKNCDIGLSANALKELKSRGLLPHKAQTNDGVEAK